MSEAVLFGIATSILQALGSSALNELWLLWDHNEHLEKLGGTITTIRNVLRDADRRQASDAAVQGWLTRLRIVLYEADDLFDSIAAQELHEKARTGSNIGKKVRHVLSKPRNFAFFVKSSRKVKGIRERLDAIAGDIKVFNFLPAQIEQDLLPYRTSREPTHSYVSANDVIGREKEKEDIVKMLLPEGLQEPKGDVVPVVVVIGIGGLGKTTLSQLVRNDDRVQQGFDLCIWSCINYFSPLKQVLVELIRSATKVNVDQELDLDTLQSKLREVIGGKRFFLVLDDVWDEDPQHWHNLKVLLNFGKVGSMVLATTRSKVVAQSLNATEPYYYLQGLSDESAWSLFKKMAFSEEEGIHGQDIEDLGRQIVTKCANVPLAIVTVGSLLRHKEKKEWVSLLNDELSKVVPQDYSKIMQILKISYNEFPYHVKSCFAYCSLFPKDHRVEKQKLVRLWIAQGFVESCVGNQTLEDTAEGYFMYLVERCFFQDMEMITEDGVIEISCRMHDLVYDLAMEVAKLESVLISKPTQKLRSMTIRHVSIVEWAGEAYVESVCSFPQSKNLRTLLFFKSKSMCNINMNKLTSCCRGLRVLDLSESRVKDIPTSIGNLIHLRYLDLSFSFVKTLPSSICSLHHLQSLILKECSSLIELPRDVGKLLSLRHLVLDGCDELCEMPIGLAGLTSLVTLDKLIIKYSRGGLKYLECLENVIGYLELVVMEDGWKDVVIAVQKSRLSKNKRLDTLCIDFRRGQSTEVEDLGELDTLMDALEPPDRLEHLTICGFGGKKISAWVMRLGNLVTLRIRRCHVCVELPQLSRLQFLKELWIGDMSSMLSVEGSRPYDLELFFPSLETLTIHDMPNLRRWWLEEPIVLPTFPRLVKVHIWNCPKLTTCVPWVAYVEDLKLRSVGEYVLWQAIGSSALKKLEISEIADLRRIEESQIRHLSALHNLIIRSCKELESVSCRGLAYLTSIQELSISECAKVKLVDVGDNNEKTKVLSRLEVVEIPNVNMWFFNRLRCTTSLRVLYISDWNEEQQSVSVKEEEEMMVPWGPLHKLHLLNLGFGDMTRNKYLLNGVQSLTSLQQLTVGKCKELHMPWRALLSLKHFRRLEIKDVEKVIEVDYDSQIQLICSNLRGLTIEGGSGEWLPDIPWKSLSSLTYLYLRRISNMEALPYEIQHLLALRHLRIWNASEELRKRCKRVTGEDWPLIRHIPNVQLY